MQSCRNEVKAEQMRECSSRRVPLRNPHTTVNQPLKKHGAGGSYTWGGVADVKDFEVVGPHREPTVTMRRLPQEALGSVSSDCQVEKSTSDSSPSAKTPLNIDSFSQFPPCGIGCTPSAVTWGPRAVAELSPAHMSQDSALLSAPAASSAAHAGSVPRSRSAILELPEAPEIKSLEVDVQEQEDACDLDSRLSPNRSAQKQKDKTKMKCVIQ